MAETLGDAVLYLRVADRNFTSGVDKAEVAANGLGKTLDACSGSAVALADKITQAATAGDRGAQAWLNAGTAIDALAAAQVQAKAETDLAKASLAAGTITLEDYNRQILQTKAGLAQFEDEHRKAQTVLREHIATTNSATGASGAQKAGLMQLTQQLGDMSTMYSLGMRPQQIFASQVGQVAGAVQLLAGEGSAFARFLAGPWGLAITGGVMVLGPLIANLLSAGDATSKASQANQTWAEKLDATKHSITEVIAALRDYNAEQKKANETTLDAAAAAAKAAAEKIGEALAERQRLAALLDAQQVSASRNAGQGTGGLAGAFGGIQIGDTQARIAENNKQLAELAEQARAATVGVAQSLAKLDTDPVARIKEQFSQLREQAEASIHNVDKLRARLAELQRQEDAQTKAARVSTKSESSADADNMGSMIALLKQLFPGVTITSTTGGKHVAGSDHYAGRAIDFVPAGGMGQYSKAEVEKILRDAGVDIRRNEQGVEQFFGPGDKGHSDHFHVAWSGDASPEEAARRAKKAAEDAVRVQAEYQKGVELIDGQELAARQQLATSAQERADIAYLMLGQQRDQREAEIRANKDFTEAQKKQLIAALDGLYGQRSTDGTILVGKPGLLQTQIARQQQQEEAQAANDTLSRQAATLEAWAQVSTNAKERARLEAEALKIQQQIQTNLLEQQIASGAVADATGARQALSSQQAAAREGLAQRNAGPLASYAAGLRSDGEDLGRQAETLVVEELDYVKQSMADAIASRLGIKDPLLKGLIELFLEQQIIKPLASALSEAASGGTGGVGGLLSSLLGSGSGSSLASSVSSTISDPQYAGLFADGGTIPSGSWGIVGEAGPEPIFATSGGVGVLPNSALRTMSSGGDGPNALAVSVSGARGNAEIQRMVDAGVRSALTYYDSIIGDRVKDSFARRGS